MKGKKNAARNASLYMHQEKKHCRPQQLYDAVECKKIATNAQRRELCNKQSRQHANTSQIPKENINFKTAKHEAGRD